jgi:hypothetical protein
VTTIRTTTDMLSPEVYTCPRCGGTLAFTIPVCEWISSILSHHAGHAMDDICFEILNGDGCSEDARGVTCVET